MIHVDISYISYSPSDQDVNDLDLLAQQISPHAKPVTKEAICNLVGNGGKILVARDASTNRIVAMGAMLPQFRVTGTIARIEHLAVDTKYRRRGIAKTILSELIVEATDRGAVRIDLGTGNPDAEALYAKLGFVHQDHEKVYWLTPTN